MNSDNLRVFLRVAEAGSVSRAGALLGLPKSTVSRQVARLESKAGTALLERAPEGMRPTDAGRVLLDHAQQMVELLDEASASMQAAGATPRGVLRVNVPHLFATGFLAPALPDFLRAHPKVEVVLEVSHAPAGAAASETHVIVRVGPLGDSALIARRLSVSELRLYAAPAALGTLVPEEARARLLEAGLAEVVPLGQYRTVVAFEDGRPVRRAQALEPLVRHGLVMAGAGAAWLPVFLCRGAVERGALLDLTPGAAVGPIPIHALYTAQAGTSPKVRAFVAFLVGIMGPPEKQG